MPFSAFCLTDIANSYYFILGKLPVEIDMGGIPNQQLSLQDVNMDDEGEKLPPPIPPKTVPLL